MAAVSTQAVYPEAVQTSVGLPGQLDASLLVSKLDFNFDHEMTEETDEDNNPDVIIVSNFKMTVGVTAKVRNRNGAWAGYAPGATKIPVTSLPWNSSLFSQGYGPATAAGAYGILLNPKRGVAKAALDDFSFDLRIHGFKPATKFPVTA